MTEIYSNNYLKIIYNLENNTCKVELKRSNPMLLLSLKKIIRGATCSDDYELLTFKAYSVEMFTSYKEKKSEKPSIYMVANMVATLGEQLKYMVSEQSYTFLGYNIENILIIDGNKFVFLDIELMSEIDEENNITIFYPFNKNELFVSPELKKATRLPINIHYKTSYFSFGCLLLYVLLSYDDAFYKEYLFGGNMSQLLNKYLNRHLIKDTKLYWLIERCLVEESGKRSILFI